MKKYQKILTVTPFLISALLFVLKALSKTELDATGVLIEKFYLLPLAYFFLFIGLAVWVIGRFVKKQS